MWDRAQLNNNNNTWVNCSTSDDGSDSIGSEVNVDKWQGGQKSGGDGGAGSYVRETGSE